MTAWPLATRLCVKRQWPAPRPARMEGNQQVVLRGPHTHTHPSPPSLAVGGKWVDAAAAIKVPDPLNGEPFTLVPDTQGDAELKPFSDKHLHGLSCMCEPPPAKSPEALRRSATATM